MRASTSILLVAVLMAFSEPASSALIDRGTGMIYDTELGITWLQDTNYGAGSVWDDGNTAGNTSTDGKMTWDNAMGWVDQLVYQGFSDWRLPTAYNSDGSGPDGGFNVTDSELGHMFYNILGGSAGSFPGPTYADGEGNSVTFENLISTYDQYWSSTEDSDTPLTGAWCFDFSDGEQYKDNKYSSPNHAWAVRNGDYGPSVSTTQTYRTDYLTLGDTFTFDYFWELGIEPTEFNLDILFFRGTQWETIGWSLNFDGTSDQWQSASFWVPEWARGIDAQIMFSVLDLGQNTDPTVYLRNIGSSSTAPVPEPATLILLGTGLLGLAGASRKKFRK